MLTNHLSLPLKEVWRALAILEGRTLGEVLRVRRGDLKDTPGFLSVAAMGQALIEEYGPDLGRTGAWVSSLEHDRAKIIKLLPEVRLKLLRLYRFTDKELEDLNARFNLKLPLASKSEYLNKLGTTPPNSVIVWINEVSGGEGGSYPMRREALEREGVAQEDVRAFRIDDDVLMPQTLRDSLSGGTVLFCTTKVTPETGNLMAYICRDDGKKVVLQHSNKKIRIPVTSADSTEGDFVSEDDVRLEFIGVSIGRYLDGR